MSNQENYLYQIGNIQKFFLKETWQPPDVY